MGIEFCKIDLEVVYEVEHADAMLQGYAAGLLAREFDSPQVLNCMKSHSKKNHYGDYQYSAGVEAKLGFLRMVITNILAQGFDTLHLSLKRHRGISPMVDY